jgi:hypothetical protein
MFAILAAACDVDLVLKKKPITGRAQGMPLFVKYPKRE